MTDFLSYHQPAHILLSPRDRHLVSRVTEGRKGTIADALIAVAGRCSPTPKRWNRVSMLPRP
jgi:hypothetical protein